MVADDGVDDLIDLLGRRAELLAHLRDTPSDKRELVADLDVPRSTLDRALRELETADLVGYEDGVYRLTAMGRRLTAEFMQFRERLERAVELEPALRWTTPEQFDLDLRWLADAEVWTPDPNDPWTMINRYVSALEAADRICGAVPLVNLRAVETVHERAVVGGATVDIVLDSGVVDRLRTDENYVSLFRDLRSRDSVSLSVFQEGPVPYLISLFDDSIVQIGVGKKYEPRALVESDDENVVTWAQETLDAYRRASVPIEEHDDADD